MFLLGIGGNGHHAFLSAREKLDSLRAGMRSKTVCEKWEAKRTDLFNKLWKGHVVATKFNRKRKDARRETHT